MTDAEKIAAISQIVVEWANEHPTLDPHPSTQVLARIAALLAAGRPCGAPVGFHDDPLDELWASNRDWDAATRASHSLEGVSNEEWQELVKARHAAADRFARAEGAAARWLHGVLTRLEAP